MLKAKNVHFGSTSDALGSRGEAELSYALILTSVFDHFPSVGPK